MNQIIVEIFRTLDSACARKVLPAGTVPSVNQDTKLFLADVKVRLDKKCVVNKCC